MLLGLFAIAAFGLTLPATKIALSDLDPVFIGLGRAVFAAVIAALILLWSKQTIPTKAQFVQLSLVALGVVIGFPVLSSWAMLYVPATHGGVVFGILPLATALVSVFIGHDRPSRSFWLVSLFGGLLVVSYALIQGAGSLHIADLALLGAVISAAIGYAVGAKLSLYLGGWQVICWALVLALPFISVPTYLFAPDSFLDWSSSTYISFLYLALISQLFAFFAWYKGLALGGIARVSQTQLLQPFVTAFASAVLLNEVVEAHTIVFIFLVVGSVWLGKKMPITQSSSHND
ncbi:EamA family transporter [Methylophaga sp. 42_25_T18]|nr:EamA family transporter [Methylophaga sp. 42_25_T18]